MKTKLKTTAAMLLIAAVTILVSGAFTDKHTVAKSKAICCAKQEEHGCIFRTLLGLEDFDKTHIVKNKELVDAALNRGLQWIVSAQNENGGWGSGSHYHQEVLNPHEVEADPASTALVGMALLRNDQDKNDAKYAAQLKKAVNYLLLAVEQSGAKANNITQLTNTQPQIKLGRNIDVILTSQFFTNYLQQSQLEAAPKQRIEKALQKCVQMIQRTQDNDGSWKDGGWAPVLQSALANNALESAEDFGVKVDSTVLSKSRDYQKNNFDAETNSVITGKAEGVMLYSVSGSARASAKEAREAQNKIDKAKKEDKLKADAKVNEENLVVAGYGTLDAKKYASAYNIRNAASIKAQTKDVLNGFGSNGGEEYLSYLMTGESLIVSGDNDWKKWYDQTTGRLIQIQNNDGSWNGHHCITSPVFCTATCMLILSIDKDIDFLVKVK